MQTCFLRLYLSADLEQIVRLFTDSVHHVGSSYYSPEELEAWAPSYPDMERWRGLLAGKYTLVAELDGKITGFGSLSEDGATVDLLFTHHEHQKEGIGTQILDALEKESATRGNEEILLTTSATAWKFYQNRGYYYYKSEKKNYGPVIFDCQILCKSLPVFPAVRRKDRILEDSDIVWLLEKGEYGVLSMKAVNGYGYGIPINYVWSGNKIYFHCAPAGFKLKNIRQDHRVSFCVVGRTQVLPEQFSTAYESVIVFGQLTDNLPEEERYRALDLLVAKYSPDEIELSKTYIAKSFRRTHILRLDIEHISGKCKKINR